MWKKNEDGGSVAWRKDGRVYWKKGLDLEGMLRECHDLPLTYIAHFRKASIGGVKPELCHPFPVNPSASTELNGSVKGTVFFHNGTLHSWRVNLFDCARAFSVKLPTGKWSDTRALAWMIHYWGKGLVDVLDVKGVLFGPTHGDLDAFDGPTGWEDTNNVWVSNLEWQNQFVRKVNSYRWCKAMPCNRHDVADNGFCPDHQPKSVIVYDANGDIISGKSGGASDNGPFLELAIAEKAFNDGLMSKKKLNKIRRKFERAIQFPRSRGAAALMDS